MKIAKNRLGFQSRANIAPLAIFRFCFGGVMLWSMLRFMAKGWVSELYVEPKMFFPFWGFEWVQPLGEWGMYTLFILLAISAACIMLGWKYRVFSWVFFLGFTYVELIDKSYYLNHYYFVSLISFLLCFLPAHRYFSLDVRRNPALKITHIPIWMIRIIQLQLAIVYFHAGIAKIHPDWLFRAMPMAIWLPPMSEMPVIGWMFKYGVTAYVMSWAGMIYDLTIPFLLWMNRTRKWAFLAVVAFHVMTWVLFDIGMFPWIMILSTLIFFPAEFHLGIIRRIERRDGETQRYYAKQKAHSASLRLCVQFIKPAIILFFFLQLLLPWRFLVYPGELFWHEQGFRFSWRVMLMEKVGEATFTVTDPQTGRSWEPDNREFLTPLQEKMMATQPDMILQFSHKLRDEYRKQGIVNPEVRAMVYVALNGRRSRLFIDPEVDLARELESFAHKSWILPFEETATLTHLK